MPGSALHDFSPTEVRAMLERDEIVLIDVREPAEFAAERIHGALNFPLSTFDARALPSGGRERVVLQCGSGKRSAMAVERCQAAGLDVDAHLAGGITAWVRAGLPTVRLDSDSGAILDPR
ncbi:rhodanese-like domain-containing protein [uncultured Phenylobacterium sp.]|uniref:rhodanese-like domain-containing protein n=1 Tax=uncultured Phenylobacterium sp. TaxID=349273 RepID=UPI0025FBC5BC|nr:rhodanese-like domain-containing protein [uncultured Phenylobacterium sp.]